MKKTETLLQSEKVKLILICLATVSLFVFVLHDTWAVNSLQRFYLGSETFSRNESRNISGIHSMTENISMSSNIVSYFCTDKGLTFDVTNSSFEVTYSEGAVMGKVKSIHKEAKNFVEEDERPHERRLPQCLIIGNFKCGTRELIDFMAMHPRIKIRSVPYYEIPFFGRLYYKGLQWYKNQMPRTYRNQITVAKDPEDFQDPSAPLRIYAMNASMRLIVMVRDPVARSISHFTFHAKLAAKFGNKLENVVVSHKMGNATGEIDPRSFFIKHSIYDEGLARYLKYFNRSQIKVIWDEDFKKCPYQVLKSVEKFLNLEHTIRPDNFVFNKEKGYFCLRINKHSKDVSCYDDLRGRNRSAVKGKVTDSAEFLQKLENFFKPHNERFFKLAGREFDW